MPISYCTACPAELQKLENATLTTTDFGVPISKRPCVCVCSELESCWPIISHASMQGQCLLCGLSLLRRIRQALPDSCFRRPTRTCLFVLCLSAVCLALHPSSTHEFNKLCCLTRGKEKHRHTPHGPSPQTWCLPSPRLPLAPVSGSWIRPSSRWSVGWEVDTAFIGQPGSTNHRPVSSQMPSGAPGARNPPAHAASALPHCTTTRTTARLDDQTDRLPDVLPDCPNNAD